MIDISFDYGPLLPAKLRRMSKRRQKIAIQRRISRELMKFVGRKYDSKTIEDVYEYMSSYLKECLLKPVVYSYRLDDPLQVVSITCKIEN